MRWQMNIVTSETNANQVNKTTKKYVSLSSLPISKFVVLGRQRAC